MIDKTRSDNVNFEKLREEAEILKVMDHTNIVKLHSVSKYLKSDMTTESIRIHSNSLIGPRNGELHLHCHGAN